LRRLRCLRCGRLRRSHRIWRRIRQRLRLADLRGRRGGDACVCGDHRGLARLGRCRLRLGTIRCRIGAVGGCMRRVVEGRRGRFEIGSLCRDRQYLRDGDLLGSALPDHRLLRGLRERNGLFACRRRGLRERRCWRCRSSRRCLPRRRRRQGCAGRTCMLWRHSGLRRRLRCSAGGRLWLDGKDGTRGGRQVWIRERRRKLRHGEHCGHAVRIVGRQDRSA